MAKRATPEQIDAFLQLFDNDAEVAIQAVQEHTLSTETTVMPARLRPVATGPVLINATDLYKEYKVGHQKIPAINGINLAIHEGEFVAITAPSGSGKSTLLQLLGGLERPTRGTVVVGGTDLGRLSDRRLSEFRGQTIGFVFQFFYLQPFLTLERNLEVPGMFAHVNRHERQARARDLAGTVGIADRLDHKPQELSGGQIQRAAIVRALMNNPKVILADEPTGNLDSKNGAGIIELFEKIRDEFGTTIVIATHDQSVANRADRIISLKDGVLV